MRKYNAVEKYIPLGAVQTYLLEIPDGETVESCQHFAFILECITQLFKHHIPTIGEKPLIIKVAHGEHFPQTRRDLQTIYLNTVPTEYSQIAYQYAHELCHYAIPGDVSSNLRWFEESICQAASTYFMILLNYLWKELDMTIQKESGDFVPQYFEDYANNQAFRFIPFDWNDPAMMHYLENNCYDRPKNNYIANKLLPIFFKYSATWEAITQLHRIHESDLQQALSAWIELAPASAHPGLHQVRDLFFPANQSEL